MKFKRTDLAESVPRREPALFDEMDRLFNSLLQRTWGHPFRDLWPEWVRFDQGLEIRPRIDVVDREGELLVRAEVPGVERENLEVELAGDLLTIKGERKFEETKEEGAFFHAEIARGSFSRSIRLPVEVAFDQASAEFKNGVLEIHLPKVQKTERRKIEVK
ncbi:Hsp20/alpha crystallin family protein [Caldichromatium japonicum]|uniref:Hsp20/alpha crystallin family protein n=1 Tax=Caldichromatium japonicum TaxID=2699430 RepID=A0A6G7VF35_9GAMM|nr:Hsp20/alpha crystallin family protein [Caldichromatium japonicum]QIK38594.1 Hsp20/alpha crystallin family protein [Caldichromatium japonicum]